MGAQSAAGLAIRLDDLAFALSDAMDAICPEVVDHHRRVAVVAHAIARQLGLPTEDVRDIALAAALHDCGAFSLRERLNTLDFEVEHPHEHASAGYRLLRSFPQFSRAASLVRYHHVPWDHGRGERWLEAPVPLGSHILHLADRVSVLISSAADIRGRGSAIRRTISRGGGPLFIPELVQAFENVADSEGFWREALMPMALCGNEGIPGCAAVSEADLKALARLFWQLVDFRSRFTATHTSGIVAVAHHLAELCGVGEQETARLTLAAGLHDLGKLGVPVEIIEKERGLTNRERAILRSHPACGFRILKRVPGLEEINLWANCHHERLDGSGYPFHLSGSEIPRPSRIIAVADVFTALTEERPYRRGRSGRETVVILRGMAEAGELDAGIVEALDRWSEETNVLRRLAQDRAAQRYLAFREPSTDIPPTFREHAA